MIYHQVTRKLFTFAFAIVCAIAMQTRSHADCIYIASLYQDEATYGVVLNIKSDDWSCVNTCHKQLDIGRDTNFNGANIVKIGTVRFGDGFGLTPPSDNQAIFTDWSPVSRNTTYYYRSTCPVYQGGNLVAQPWVPIGSITPIARPQPPQPLGPVFISASPQCNAVQLDWNPVEGASKYSVARSDGIDTNTNGLQSLRQPSTSIYIGSGASARDVTATAGKLYYYQVYVTGDNRYPTWAFAAASSIPNPVASLNATANTGGVVLDFAYSPLIKSYVLQRSQGGGWEPLGKILAANYLDHFDQSTNSLSWFDRSARKDQTYMYRLLVENTCGKTAQSMVSTIKSIGSSQPCALADLVDQTGMQPPDGMLTVSDVVQFINSFFQGCPGN